MIWPPVKAWTSKLPIDGQVHFVAINYGGESPKEWVVLMSVLDSSVVLKVSWSKLIDSSNWKSGWDEITHLEYSKLDNNISKFTTTDFSCPSLDSGLTMPIDKNAIRPWFDNPK